MTSIIERLQSCLKEVSENPEAKVDDAARAQALVSAKSLVGALEKPEDVVMHYAFEVSFSSQHLGYYTNIVADGIAKNVSSPWHRIEDLSCPG